LSKQVYGENKSSARNDRLDIIGDFQIADSLPQILYILAGTATKVNTLKINVSKI